MELCQFSEDSLRESFTILLPGRPARHLRFAGALDFVCPLRGAPRGPNDSASRGTARDLQAR